MENALCGTRSAGARWHDIISETEFVPLKADPVCGSVGRCRGQVRVMVIFVMDVAVMHW